MNRQKAIALIAASTVAGVVCAVGAYAAVATNRDPDVPSAKTGHTPTTSATTSPPRTTLPPTTPVTPKTSNPTVSPPKSTLLSVDNLVQTSVLTALGYPVDAGTATRADGDLQYITTPCVKESMNGLTGGNVFSGSWPMTDGGMVSESISVAVASEPAAGIAEQAVGWHHGTCRGWDVGVHHRTKVAGGFTDWVELTGTGDERGQVQRAAVIQVNARIAILGVATSGHSQSAFLALLNKAVAALT